MKTWQLVMLGLILVSLVLFYFLKQRPRSQEIGKLFITLLSELKDKEPDFIEAFSRNDDTSRLLLKREKHGWMIFVKQGNEGFWVPAKDQKVKKLLLDLSDFTGELRSSSRQYLEDFGLGTGQGLEIILKNSGKQISQIVVGKKGPSWGSCFVKRDDESKVYLVSRDLLADFDIWTDKVQGPLEVRPWIDLNVLSLDPQDVILCSYSKDDNSWSLKRSIQKDTKNSGTWIFIRDKKKEVISHKKALKILGKLFPIHARDVASANDLQKKMSSKDRGLFICKDNRGMMHSLSIVHCSKEEELCLVKNEKGYVYKVDKKVVDELRNPLTLKETAQHSGKEKSSHKR